MRLPVTRYSSLYSDEGLTSETSVSIRSFLRCRIYIFITKLSQLHGKVWSSEQVDENKRTISVSWLFLLKILILKQFKSGFSSVWVWSQSRQSSCSLSAITGIDKLLSWGTSNFKNYSFTCTKPGTEYKLDVSFWHVSTWHKNYTPNEFQAPRKSHYNKFN